MKNIGDADFYEAMTEGLHVGSWCPTPTPTTPATQVHLTIPSSLGKVLLRFKSPWSLDQLIAALIKHRCHVFGVPTDHNVWKVP
jgi:hypothetical protein